MKESTFYELEDFVQKLQNVTNGYYPTVATLKAHKVEEKIEKYLPIIMYFASDPLRKEIKEEQYKETVKYCKTLTTTVELEEE